MVKLRKMNYKFQNFPLKIVRHQ